MSKISTNLEWHRPDEKPAMYSSIIVLRDWKHKYSINFDLGIINVYCDDFDILTHYSVLAWAYLPSAEKLMKDLDIDTEVNYEDKAISTILA